MKSIYIFCFFLILVTQTYSQTEEIWKNKLQATYDSTKFIPKIQQNGYSFSFIEARPTLWYAENTNELYNSFTANFLIKVEGNMVDGQRQGVFTYSLIDKIEPSKNYKLYEQTFKDDELNGIWKSYSLNEKLVLLQTFKSGNPFGLQQEYRPDGKTLLKETEILPNDLSIIREFYATGKLMTETPYLNGKPNGIGKKFYPNQILEDYVEFKFGEMEGVRKYYHDNGLLWIEQIYFANRPWETIANYDRKGKKRDGGTLKDGTGTIIFYNEDDSIRETNHFINGLLEKE